MAVHFAKGMQVSIGGSAVGQVTDVGQDRSDGIIDITNFDSTSREFAKLGLMETEVTLTVQYDLGETGQDALRSGLEGTSDQALVLYPEGNTTGKPSLTWAKAQVYQESVSGSGVEGVISATYTIKLSDELTEGTVV